MSKYILTELVHVQTAGETALREAQAALAAERERCARLAALLTARQQAADERIGSLERRLACLAGDADALSACTAAELEALEQVGLGSGIPSQKCIPLTQTTVMSPDRSHSLLASVRCCIRKAQPHRQVVQCCTMPRGAARHGPASCRRTSSCLSALQKL